MDTFVVDGDRLALRERIRTLLDSECRPAHVRAAETAPQGWSTRRWKALASVGAVGLTLPIELGGGGRDESWFVMVLEEAGRAALPEALGPAWVASALLADVGSDDQRQRWLPAIAAGDAVAVASLPGRPDVESAHIADVILLAEGREVHAFPRDAVQLVPRPSTDGSRRFAVTATINARSCLAVRAAEVIALASDRATLAEAALLLGTAEKLVELARHLARERKQSGREVAEVPEQQLRTAAQAVESLRREVYAAAGSVASDAPGRTAHVKVARTLASQSADLAGRVAVALQDEARPTGEHNLDLWLRRALPRTGGS